MNRPDAITIADAVPADLLARAVGYIESLDPAEFDVYKHRFEPKLQVKKRNNTATHLAALVEFVRSPEFLCLFEYLFDLPGLSPSSDYFTSFYIYRPGDYLQRHIDAAVHGSERKIVTVNLYMTSCDGGELSVGQKVIPAQANTIVAFTNHDDSYHAVSPVTSGKRMMLTTGLCLPVSAFPRDGFTRLHTKAWFAPGPGENWTADDYKLRDSRASMGWGNM